MLTEWGSSDCFALYHTEMTSPTSRTDPDFPLDSFFTVQLELLLQLKGKSGFMDRGKINDLHQKGNAGSGPARIQRERHSILRVKMKVCSTFLTCRPESVQLRINLNPLD